MITAAISLKSPNSWQIHKIDILRYVEGTGMEKQISLDSALEIVKKEALKKCAEHRELIGKTPLSGWSQEKHDQYHTLHGNQAEITASWCFVRQMQINPD